MKPVGVTVTVESGALQARLGELAGPKLAEALSAGLALALMLAAGEVQITASEVGMQQRSGMLSDSILGWLTNDGALEGFVGVPGDSPAAKYAYLLTDAIKTIVPQGHPYLAIPVAANLTGAGVPRFSSPTQLPAGEFVAGQPVPIDWGGQRSTFEGLSYGIVKSETRTESIDGRTRRRRAGYDPYFVLVHGVHVQGFDVLGPTLQAVLPEMTQQDRKSVV